MTDVPPFVRVEEIRNWLTRRASLEVTAQLGPLDAATIERAATAVGWCAGAMFGTTWHEEALRALRFQVNLDHSAELARYLAGLP